MTLSLPGVDVLPPGSARLASLSQWMTPPPIAKRMARWAGNVGGRVLEPSAGNGALVQAWHDRVVGTEDPDGPCSLDAVEIDPAFCLRGWECCDYLQRAAPADRYALALMNPPYEDGLDGEFIVKAMRECDRVIALVRLAALAGNARHADVWRRVERHHDGWWMPGLAIFPGRPVFDGPESASGSAKSDFCVVKLSRIGTPERTAIEWWTL